MQNFQQLIMHR